ncbi:Gfo/Idh/MocA family protein [Streptomyces ovatisporus]|uniref:Gfo/Idh/MocA family protein n=1 Tax=Streptomyces ovatisporus TaxID=1128682 RepID=A0ABV8ZZ27_9ACTN
MKFGLLGTGPWAASTHGPALATHKDAQLTGVWGRRPEAARALADELGTRPYDDVDALLSDCDAVAVALPPDVQAPLAVRAAGAGCHLLLDKPVATTPEAARQVSDAVRAAGVASVVFFTLRFSGPTASWIEEQAGIEGWLTGRADWLSPVFGGGDSPYTASPWRRERGALWDVGPHALSVLLPVLGDVDDLEDVRAARGAGDTVHVVLRHERGASSTCTLSHSMPPAASGVSAELRGSAGTARLPERDESPVDAFARAVDALDESARTGRAHPCDVRFAQRVTEILAQVESALG